MKIIGIPILSDNYVWIIKNLKNDCIIVDPGESNSIYKIINVLKLNPQAIFLTHNHHDHTLGVKELKQIYPKIFVFGPLETKKFGLTHLVQDKDNIQIKNFKFSVISTPGHTQGHISYYSKPFLFCGDTLFSGGCGKVIPGMMLEMYNSLKTIFNFPDETLIYCSHEYTKSNLEFAKKILPNNKKILKYYNKIKNLNNQCSLPSTLKIEKQINPFFMLYDNVLKKSIGINSNECKELDILIKLRQLKEKIN